MRDRLLLHSICRVILMHAYTRWRWRIAIPPLSHMVYYKYATLVLAQGCWSGARA